MNLPAQTRGGGPVADATARAEQRHDETAPWPPGLAPPTADPAEDLSPRRSASWRRPDGSSLATASPASPSRRSPPRPARTRPPSATTSAARTRSSRPSWSGSTTTTASGWSRSCRRSAPGAPASTCCCELQREGCTSHEENQLFFDLLPHVLRDPALARDSASCTRGTASWTAGCSRPTRRGPATTSRRLAALAIAVGDGLTIQCAADHSFDVDAVYALWERLFRGALEELSDAVGRLVSRSFSSDFHPIG